MPSADDPRHAPLPAQIDHPKLSRNSARTYCQIANASVGSAYGALASMLNQDSKRSIGGEGLRLALAGLAATFRD